MLTVPRVEFERSSYQDAVFPDDTVSAATVPVCLVYNDTGSEVYGQFDVVVELTKIGSVIPVLLLVTAYMYIRLQLYMHVRKFGDLYK